MMVRGRVVCPAASGQVRLWASMCARYVPASVSACPRAACRCARRRTARETPTAPRRPRIRVHAGARQEQARHSGACYLTSAAGYYDLFDGRAISTVNGRLGLEPKLCGRCAGGGTRDGVVPLTVPVMPGKRNRGRLGVGDLDPGRVGPAVEFGADLQARAGRGLADEIDDDLVGDQRAAA